MSQKDNISHGFTLKALIKCCNLNYYLNKGKLIHEYLRQYKFKCYNKDITLKTILIDFYGSYKD